MGRFFELARVFAPFVAFLTGLELPFLGFAIPLSLSCVGFVLRLWAPAILTQETRNTTGQFAKIVRGKRLRGLPVYNA